MENNIEEIKVKLETFVPQQQTLYKLMKEQTKRMNELIYDICMSYGNDGEVDLANEDGDYDLCVIYDGGNHPEYASNVCSTVYSVKAEMCKDVFEDKEIKAFSVHTEDTPNYEYYRIPFEDKDAILDALVGKFNLYE